MKMNLFFSVYIYFKANSGGKGKENEAKKQKENRGKEVFM